MLVETNVFKTTYIELESLLGCLRVRATVVEDLNSIPSTVSGG